jgi:hypothetical protein
MESNSRHDAVGCLECAARYRPEPGRPGCPRCGHTGWLAATIPVPPPPDHVTSCYVEWLAAPVAARAA